MILNKNLTDISLKEWHSIMQQVHVNELQRQGVEAITEKRLNLKNGHKSYRKADIYVPSLSLVMEGRGCKMPITTAMANCVCMTWKGKLTHALIA